MYYILYSRSLALSALGYAVFIIANIFGIPGLTVGISVFVGLAAGVLWNAEGNYLAACAVIYHDKMNICIILYIFSIGTKH